MDDLARAEKNVADSERNVQRQREIIARLERQGLDAKIAKDLLVQFELTLTSRRRNLDQIRDNRAP